MSKKREETNQKKTKRAVGLNLILLLCFLLFAIVLIVFFTLVQYYQNNEHYRRREEDNVAEACERVREALLEQMEGSIDPDNLYFDVNGVMLSYANRYAVNVYLFAETGEFIFPEIPDSEIDEYVQVYYRIKEQFDLLREELGEGSSNGGIHPYDGDLTLYDTRISFISEESASCAAIVILGNWRGYLYVVSSFDHLNALIRDMLWNSLTTALFAIALSLVVSCLVSMFITRPVTRVTDRAKALAHGEYDSNQSRYFCSELNDLSEALDYACSEISKTDQLQKELIANVSHDFRTPLTMIKAYAAMMQEISGDDPVKRAKHTQIIIDEADRLATLVNDLLDLSRMQAGMDDFERKTFNLSEDLYGVVNRFEFLSLTRGYTFQTDIDDDLYAYANKERIEQVLYNLIGNAVNYTGDDKTVTIRLKKKADCARFEVIDSGKGIPPEELKTIWERYYRSSETHKRPVKGSGLGLSIVKNVLKVHGFAFGVESEMGKGSCFWVEFPDPPEVGR